MAAAATVMELDEKTKTLVKEEVARCFETHIKLMKEIIRCCKKSIKLQEAAATRCTKYAKLLKKARAKLRGLKRAMAAEAVAGIAKGAKTQDQMVEEAESKKGKGMMAEAGSKEDKSPARRQKKKRQLNLGSSQV